MIIAGEEQYVPYAYNPWEYPGAPPAYISSYDPALFMGLEGITPNREGLVKFRGEALRDGPSTWSKLANAEQDLYAKRAQSAAAAESGSRAAEARSALAMRGGLTSGARERVAKQSSRDLMGMAQQIRQERAGNALQIGMNDERNRIQQLGMLPGMENQAVEPERQTALLKIQAQMRDREGRNAYNQNRYNTQMQGWAANQQAMATQNSGK